MRPTLWALFLVSLTAQAAQLTIVNVTGTGTFNNSLSIIHDNVIPAEGSGFNQSDKVWWNGLVPTFTLDIGAVYLLQDFVASLDNNDTYRFEVSTDGSLFTTLVDVLSSQGEIGNGMDTFSTVSGNGEYVAGIDFAATQARYVRVSAIGGDNLNSIGEVQLFGDAAVPEPATFALMGAGLGVLALFRRR